MSGTITTTYLELTAGEAIRPPAAPVPVGFGTRIVRDPTVNADLYGRVGAGYAWTDRLVWSAAQWERWAERVETHLVELGARACGYYEIEADSPDSAKVSIFGLLPEFHGLGLGGHALTAALTRALALRPRVWLTTCTLDGPHALANYQARGMRPFRVETFAAPVASRRA